MAKKKAKADVSSPTEVKQIGAKIPLTDKARPLSRGQRIHRRRTLAQQRRDTSNALVTARR